MVIKFYQNLMVAELNNQNIESLDSLMSIVQMPRGYPVGTVAIGEWGAVNAGILAAQIIGLIDSSVQENLENRRGRITAEIEATTYVKPEVD